MNRHETPPGYASGQAPRSPRSGEADHPPASLPYEWAQVLAGCVATIRPRYRLRWHGLHGVTHWARVLDNGLRLALATPGVRVDVVTAFAVLHDSCRHNDLDDPRHGPRAASFARQLARAGRLPLDTDGLALLTEACRTHTGGRGPGDPTVVACWDSDRLDLPRIAGIEVNTDWLGTPLAQDPSFLAAATRRARARVFPFGSLFDPGE